MCVIEDTIFAESTSPGRSGISVIRISGPKATDTAGTMLASFPEPRQAGVRWLVDPVSKRKIDQCLVLVFPRPNSFTGEDLVEIHCHGSRAVVRTIQSILGSYPSARVAEPGEFTRRALMNGRIDLVQAEGLADLLVAETELQLKQAIVTMSGVISQRAEQWRSELVDVLSRIEVGIDFADEELPTDLLAPLGARLEVVYRDMESVISGSRIAERIREGFRVAVVGRPNVGKSTLLNRLAQRDVAITSDIAGTTRDIIEVHLDVHGIPVTMLDMAGMRESSDVVEALGVARAKDAASQADLRVFLVESDDDFLDLGVIREKDDIVVQAKGDLEELGRYPRVSGKTGLGIPLLISKLGEVLENRVQGASPVSHRRQIEPIQQAVTALITARDNLVGASPMEEQVSIEIRAALRQLEFLVGHVDVEDILDSIFKSFCLGK